MRVRENAESIAFYGGEGGERQLLLARFDAALGNLREVLLASRNLQFFTSSYRFLIRRAPSPPHTHTTRRNAAGGSRRQQACRAIFRVISRVLYRCCCVTFLLDVRRRF